MFGHVRPGLALLGQVKPGYFWLVHISSGCQFMLVYVRLYQVSSGCFKLVQLVQVRLGYDSLGQVKFC